MKSIFPVSIFALFLFSCNSFNSPISYNDTIIKPQLEAVVVFDSIYSNPEISVLEIKKQRIKLGESVEETLAEIKNLEDYKGNTSFREAALKYFSHLNLIYNKTENIDSLIYNFNSDERIETMSDKDYNFMEAELKKYLELENVLLDEQKKFAQQFNMRLDY